MTQSDGKQYDEKNEFAPVGVPRLSAERHSSLLRRTIELADLTPSLRAKALKAVEGLEAELVVVRERAERLKRLLNEALTALDDAAPRVAEEIGAVLAEQEKEVQANEETDSTDAGQRDASG